MIPRKTLEARRPTGGTRVKGKWVDGSYTVLPNVKTTVQMINGNELQPLPEGRRSFETFVCYIRDRLNTVLDPNDEQPDELLIYGEWCEIVHRGSWQNLRKHYRYIVQRKTDK